MITVERLGDDLISLSGWDGPETPAKCRACSGRFHKPTKTWHFRMDMSTCRALRAQFPDLVIGPELNSWARAAKREETQMGLLSMADGAALDHVPTHAPRLAAAMGSRTYQQVAAKWGAVTGSFLLADQQGLGKTIETIATIIEHSKGSPGWHLITCPSVAVDAVWAPEIRRWLGDRPVVVIPLVGSLAQRQAALTDIDIPYHTEHVFVIANIEAARIRPEYDEERDPSHKKPKWLAKNALLPALHGRAWDTVVVDECQRALIRTTGKMNQTRAGFNLLSRNAKRRIALSGTPMRGKPEQLWGTLHWLRPDVYRSYWQWVARYFHLDSNGFSNYVLGGFLDGGEDLLAADLRTYMLRRTKAEVLTDLPPKQYAGSLMDPDDENSPLGVWLEPTKDQMRQMDEFALDGSLDFGEDGEMLAQGSLAEYTRLKQLANAVHALKNGVMTPTLDSPKYEWILNWLGEADGAKVVISSQFTAVIDAFADGLRAEGYTVATLTGKTPQKERARMVEEFQSTDKVQIFMLNTKAGGVALTLDAADYLILIDETTVPDDQEQVEDRIHRASRMHNVTIYYLRTLGSLDEEIAWIAAARLSVAQYLLDGARGVETARSLYQHTRELQNANT